MPSNLSPVSRQDWKILNLDVNLPSINDSLYFAEFLFIE